ncbi:hypothetical protein [Leptolyngbya sp. FACHB-17]|uniref:hypothetical protein n=1 Tax=unclassified Leptolyngbya TaxID=2650499 RepID=UPI001681B327|nr:hypothetical protein [Leptolyngbya sp. FACHB-17]MBD2079894.1 hypothetical protein [Leptolyngbya sp. FACHB-17]
MAEMNRCNLRSRLSDVIAFCDRWELDEGDLYKALGELRKKGIVVSISSQLNLQLS